ncbi:uncharacterized protein VTP21DRAFT_9247 [Calcarisporiella thermophila]|uniref:uncharacterized protein n=1 Tax=Calcarisporiella thermophila TaxID=911321 RepID=UPI003744AF72
MTQEFSKGKIRDPHSLFENNQVQSIEEDKKSTTLSKTALHSNVAIQLDLKSESNNHKSTGDEKIPNNTNDQTLRNRNFYFVLGSLSLSLFMASLDNTIVSTALTTIASEFKAFDAVSWVATSYLLASNSIQPIYGKLADIFGGKVTYIFAMAIFMIGSALCGASQSILMLIISRGIQGIGGAGMISLPMVLLVKLVDVKESGKYIGAFGIVYALSSTLGPILGGVFTDKVSWRWAFYINLPLGAIGFGLALVFLKLMIVQGSLLSKPKRIDWLGSITFVCAVICILLATTWGGNSYPWNGPVIIALYCVSVALIAAFFFIEVRIAAEPIIPLRLFKRRNFAISSILTILMGMSLYGLIFFIPMFFQAARGEPATNAGLQLIPLMVLLAIFATITGNFVSRTGNYRAPIIIGVVLVTIGTGLLILLGQHSSTGLSIGFLLINGIGAGLSFQTTVTAAQATLPKEDISPGTTVIAFFRTIGGVIGLAIYNSILFNRLIAILSTYANSDALISAIRKGFEFIRKMPPSDQEIIANAYTDAVNKVFIAMTPFAGIMILLALLLENIPLSPKRPTAAAKPSSAEQSDEADTSKSPV